MTNEPSGLGPKLPPLNDAREGIQKVIENLSKLLNGRGIPFTAARLTGLDKLNLQCRIEQDEDNQEKLVVDVLDPQPRLEILSLIKNDITSVVVTTEKIDIAIDGFPDISIEVES